MHPRLDSVTLSQLAFPGEGNPNFPWEKSDRGNAVIKSKSKKLKKICSCSTRIVDTAGCDVSGVAFVHLGLKTTEAIDGVIKAMSSTTQKKRKKLVCDSIVLSPAILAIVCYSGHFQRETSKRQNACF